MLITTIDRNQFQNYTINKNAFIWRHNVASESEAHDGTSESKALQLYVMKLAVVGTASFACSK